MGLKFIKTRDRTNEFDKTNVCVETDIKDMNLIEVTDMFVDFLLAIGFLVKRKEIVEDVKEALNERN